MSLEVPAGLAARVPSLLSPISAYNGSANAHTIHSTVFSHPCGDTLADPSSGLGQKSRYYCPVLCQRTAGRECRMDTRECAAGATARQRSLNHPGYATTSLHPGYPAVASRRREGDVVNAICHHCGGYHSHKFVFCIQGPGSGIRKSFCGHVGGRLYRWNAQSRCNQGRSGYPPQ